MDVYRYMLVTQITPQQALQDVVAAAGGDSAACRARDMSQTNETPQRYGIGFM